MTFWTFILKPLGIHAGRKIVHCYHISIPGLWNRINFTVKLPEIDTCVSISMLKVWVPFLYTVVHWTIRSTCQEKQLFLARIASCCFWFVFLCGQGICCQSSACIAVPVWTPHRGYPNKTEMLQVGHVTRGTWEKKVEAVKVRSVCVLRVCLTVSVVGLVFVWCWILCAGSTNSCGMRKPWLKVYAWQTGRLLSAGWGNQLLSCTLETRHCLEQVFLKTIEDLSTVCGHSCSQNSRCVNNTNDALDITRLCVTLFPWKEKSEVLSMFLPFQ